MAEAGSIIGMWESFGGAGLALHPGRCVVVRNRHASCRLCAQACPTGAIAVVDGALSVDASRCDGCGKCAAACPTEAILAPDDAAALAPEPPFRVMRDGTLPHFLPARRKRLLEQLAAADDPAAVDLSGQRWGEVAIDVDRCASCRMCAVFCPTGALERVEGRGGTFGLQHTPALCVRCRACADVCYTGALTLSDNPRVDDLRNRAVRRIKLQPMSYERGGPHSATNAIRHIVGSNNIYER